MISDEVELRARALAVLEAHWRADVGYCVPNPDTYPHQWLWDSAFHAIAWARLGDDRGTVELASLLGGALPDGMVPHMRYGGTGPDTWLGPLPTSSSITQPPMYGHAIAELHRAGVDVPERTTEAAVRGIQWLLQHRRDPSGLIAIVHPWEAGNDHSPRFDGWGAPARTPATYDQRRRSAWNKELMRSVVIGPSGSALHSDRFEVCPAGFNAYVAFNARELAEVVDDDRLRSAADELAVVIDDLLWDEATGLWVDRPIVGAGIDTATLAISDGVMPALVTADPVRARTALARLTDPEAFGGTPYGPTNVGRREPSYDPGAYWRGAAWPNMSYLLWLAARRWDDHELADTLARATRQGAVASGWAEYWNPETGEGLGARPQSWTSLVAALTPAGR